MKFKFVPKYYLAPNSEGSSEGGGVAPESPNSSSSEQGGGEDVTGLKNALSAERKRASESEKQLKQLQLAYEGVDPAVAKQAQDRLKQLQQQQEEWNQRETQLKNTLTEDFNRRHSEAQKTAQGWQEKYEGLLKRTLAEQAYQSAGGRSGGADDGMTFFDSFFNNVSASLRLNEKGQLEVVDGTGARIFSKKNTSEPMNPMEFFNGFTQHPVFGYCFAAQGNSRGGGMQPGSSNVARNGSVRVIDRSDLSALSEPGVIEALAKGDGSVVLR